MEQREIAAKAKKAKNKNKEVAHQLKMGVPPPAPKIIAGSEAQEIEKKNAKN